MKNILFFILSVILSLSLTSGIQKTDDHRTIILKASANISESALKQSSDILTARLNLFGIKSFEVKPEGPGQLKVTISDNSDAPEIEGLLTTRGGIEFYETFVQDEISSLLSNDKQILTLLTTSQPHSPSDPRVGCSMENRQKIEVLLKSSAPENCKLVWGFGSDCLFALKSNPLLGRSDLESVKFTGQNDHLKIQITLKPAAATAFADATRRNIDKCIAIVFDGKVFSWPRVRDEIKGGKVEVTGNFNDHEIKFFPVIFNTDELPTDFTIVR